MRVYSVSASQLYATCKFARKKWASNSNNWFVIYDERIGTANSENQHRRIHSKNPIWRTVHSNHSRLETLYRSLLVDFLFCCIWLMSENVFRCQIIRWYEPRSLLCMLSVSESKLMMATFQSEKNNKWNRNTHKNGFCFCHIFLVLFYIQLGSMVNQWNKLPINARKNVEIMKKYENRIWTAIKIDEMNTSDNLFGCMCKPYGVSAVTVANEVKSTV